MENLVVECSDSRNHSTECSEMGMELVHLKKEGSQSVVSTGKCGPR